MITYEKYISVLDDLRIDHGLTVEELCEGIISPRSYYRYLNKTSVITMDILHQLINRLNLNLGNVAIYGIHFKSEDAGVTRFIFRVHNKSYHDIKPIYERVLKLNLSNRVAELCLNTFIYKYQKDVNEITADEYREKLLLIYEEVKDLHKKDIRIVLIYISLIEIGENVISYAEIADLILEIDFRVESMYYFFALDRALRLSVKANVSNMEKYRRFLKHAKMIFDYFYIRNIMMNYSLYIAYEKYKTNDYYNEDLYKHLTNAIGIYGKPLINEIFYNVGEVFKINAKDFLVKETKKQIERSYIKLI